MPEGCVAGFTLYPGLPVALPRRMLVSLGWFIAGIAVLILGANLLVRGGTQLAAQLGISPLLIGLTLVALGTSSPELAVGIDAALQGNGSLSIGNIAGANMFNLLVALGFSALVRPLLLRTLTLRFDLPAMAVAALLLLVLAWDGRLTRLDGVILVGAGIAYTAGIVVLARRESRAVRAEFVEEYGQPVATRTMKSMLSNGALLLVGIGIIVMGAGWLVDGAVGLARRMGVSDAFIGLTIVAFGTSSPEFFTTMVATYRGERDIAVGNLVGSVVYNIVVILGIVCLVPSGGVDLESDLVRIDLPIMAAATLVCLPVFFTGRRVSRWEGVFMIGAYCGYLTYLLITRT